MTWIAGCIVIIGMAAGAGIRGIRIITVMTGVTIVGDWNMRTRHDKILIVVKGGWIPSVFVVASRTVR